ncbi:hypothetical protein SteCoe_21719 [Stentor coeruleus]|uniref:Uncharacterized protein n=1 Tax=Stentor coeruleus TaxID=5963 RepID=A0A1R2BPG7_9CILI|nr:hypothetical protein SteCoe_21719 [Stentor coeruleus]
MCAWMKWMPSPDQLKTEPYKKFIEEITEQNAFNTKTPSTEKKEFFVSTYKEPNKKQYLEDLRNQIDSKTFKKQEELAEKKSPGICKDFSGYPDRPVTPKLVKRQAELQTMKKLKHDLDNQTAYVTNQTKALEMEEKEKINSILIEDWKKHQEYEDYKKSKKNNEQSTLTESWNKTISLKKTSHSSNIQNPKDALYTRNSYNQQQSLMSFPNPNKSPLITNVRDGSRSLYDQDQANDKKSLSVIESKINKILEAARNLRNEQSNLMVISRPKVSIINGGRRHYSPGSSINFS